MQDARTALAGVGLIQLDASSPGQAWPDKDFNQINRFLNRLLGCPVLLQNAIFQFFSDVMAAVILEAKRNGRWDLGILDLGSNDENQDAPDLVETRLFTLSHNCETTSRRVVEMHTVLVERGLTWEKAVNMYDESRAKGFAVDFYASNQSKNSHQHRIILLAISSGTETQQSLQSFSVYKPNTGLQTRVETRDTLEKKKFTLIDSLTDARSLWEGSFITN